MSTKEPVTLVELDIPVCSLTYGTSPCTASLGVTGDIKCFNSIRTCQDRANFTRSVLTLRMMRPTPGSPYDAIPNVAAVSVTPPQLDPGKSMGVRASVSITCGDHPHGDALFDKYLADRGYDAFKSGTFWPKLRARWPSLESAPVRILRGFVGDALEDMRVEHYFLTGMSLDNKGIKITAKDSLSFCDPKKAQCPTTSTGKILTDIISGAASLTLTPVGVGDDEYPASGYVCLSNKEVVSFTRAADVLTLTAHALFGSTQQAHEADSVVQLCKVYDAQSPADIIYDLLVNFTPGIDASWCDLPAWQEEADTYIGHLYTAVLATPTAVNTLINEMCEQAGINLWGDAERNTIEFRTLRPVAPGAVLHNDSRIVMGSFKSMEQPATRMSLVATYYAVANVVEKLDKEPNFRAVEVNVDAEADQDYDGIPAIKKNYSRWIGIDNRPAANRLNQMLLSRFRDPPRKLAWSIYLTDPNIPSLGQGVFLSSSGLQDVQGQLANVPAIVTSISPMEDGYSIEAQELRFAGDLIPDSQRTVFIDSDHFNLNLRTLYDSLYSSVPEGEYAQVTFQLSPGAWIGSLSGASPSLNVGDWPEDVLLVLVIGTVDSDDAQVLGHGGDGGGYPGPSMNGSQGSTAIYTRRAITITNLGVIGGGAGGGGGMIESPFTPIGGGGGAGFSGYTFGGARMGGHRGNNSTSTDSEDGGTLFGGDGGQSIAFNNGGDGGDLGNAGDNSDGTGTGGPAGKSIDGWSYVTFTDALPGTIYGSHSG